MPPLGFEPTDYAVQPYSPCAVLFIICWAVFILLGAFDTSDVSGVIFTPTIMFFFSFYDYSRLFGSN